MTLRAVDLSHVKAITDWDALCRFADILIFKATEGTGFADPLFASRLAEARRRGKLIGVYHYVGSSTARRVFDATAEADWFVAHYTHQPGEVPIYDYEPAVPPADPDGWLATAMQRSMSKGWPVPMVYMNTSAAASNSWTKTRALNAALWIARYFANNGQVPTQEPSPGSFGGYAMWQYTSNGQVPGVAGPTDVSLFYGTPAAWQAIGGINTQEDDDMPYTQWSDEDKLALAQDVYKAIWFGVSGAPLIPNNHSGQGEWPYTTMGWIEDRIGREILAPALQPILDRLAGLATPTVDEDALATAIVGKLPAQPADVGGVKADVLAALREFAAGAAQAAQTPASS